LYESDYAFALKNLAGDLDKLGSLEALTYSQESVDIYCRLIGINPDRYEPEYADALIDLSVYQFNSGNYLKAAQNSEHSLQIYQRLAEIRPERFEPNYAHILNNFGSSLSYQGLYQEAFEHTQQAFAIYHRFSVSI
jgi:tetratricopeptide (TPR) repeat protein